MPGKGRLTVTKETGEETFVRFAASRFIRVCNRGPAKIDIEIGAPLPMVLKPGDCLDNENHTLKAKISMDEVYDAAVVEWELLN